MSEVCGSLGRSLCTILFDPTSPAPVPLSCCWTEVVDASALPFRLYELQDLFLASNLSIETAAKLFPPINKI